jgi:outer membrane protein assembly factor BamB
MNRVFVALVALAAAGCPSTAFTPAFPENQEPEITTVLRTLASPPAREQRAVIAGARPGGLFAWDITAGRMLFSVDTEVRSAPVLAGNVVVTQEAEGIVGRDLDTGEVRFELEEEWTLIGADGDGSRAVVSASYGPETSPHGVVALASAGSVLWSHELQMPSGVPALVGDIVVLPWATQRISFLDAQTGTERARMRMQDCVVGQTVVAEGGVFAGQHGLVHLRPGAEAGVRERVAWWEPLVRPLPAQPPLLPDGYTPVPPPDGAQHRVRQLFGLATGEGGVRLFGDAMYFQFYRLLFALAPSADEMKWVYRNEADLVGGAATPNGVLAIGRDGRAVFVDAANGRRTWEASLGIEVLAASVRPGAFQPPPAEAQAPEPLQVQLYAAAALDDSRLGAGRALAAQYLARFPEEAVTEQLVGLCAGEHAPEPLRIVACRSIGERTTGVGFVRDALANRASFLEGTRAPPVGALAKAAGAMRARMLVPVLVRHLEDPGTPGSELAGLFEGLAALGDRSAAPAIERFVTLYHAEDGDAHMTAALVAAANALATLRVRSSGDVLRRAADDPLASDRVREGMRAALAALEAPPPSDTPAPPPEPEPEPEPAPDTRPERITAQMTERVFQPAIRRLRRCLGQEPRARIALVVDPGGAVSTVVVNPESVRECMEPLIRPLTFPATRQTSRENVTYVVFR